MSEWPEKPIWNLYRFNWILAAVVTAMLALGLAVTDFHVRATSVLIVLSATSLYGIFGYLNAFSPRKRNPRIAFAFSATAQMIVLLSTMISLSYIATSANLPLMDTRLLAIDRAFGWDFRAYLSFINDRPWLLGTLALAYRAISLPILMIIFVLPFAGYYRRSGEFVTAFTVALLVTTVISTLIPATGVYGTIGVLPSDYPNVVPQAYYDGMLKIPALRDGSLRELDLLKLDGVLTFPSFHAAAAVLYAWAFWEVRWFRPLNLLINGAMICATPAGGGHYFIDVFAGLVVALASIYAAHRISALAFRQTSHEAAPAQQAPAIVPGLGYPERSAARHR
jgi:PAP2 superfamily